MTTYGTVVCLVGPDGRSSFVASSARSGNVTAVWEGDTLVVTGLAPGLPADRIDADDPGPPRLYRCEQQLCVLER